MQMCLLVHERNKSIPTYLIDMLISEWNKFISIYLINILTL